MTTQTNSNGVHKVTSIIGIVVQTIVLLLALTGGWVSLMNRVSAIDAHLLLTTNSLRHHVETDHYQKDLSRLQLHNSCAGAMAKGCHDQGVARIDSEKYGGGTINPFK